MALRRRATALLAVVYLACVIAPPVALALGDSGVAADCLFDHDHEVVAAHVHADGNVHRHADASAIAHDHDNGLGRDDHESDGKSRAGTCCGLFSLSATLSDTAFRIDAPLRSQPVSPRLAESLAGRGPDRVNRPPIVLASL
jgi:hypothetical protein